MAAPFWRTTRGLLFAACAAAAIWAPLPSIAAPISWTNALGGNWQDSSNWSSSPLLPTATDDLSFSLNSTYTVTSSADAQVHDIIASTGSLTLALGTSTLTAHSLNTSATTAFNFASGSIILNGGSYTPKQGNVTWFYSPVLSNTYNFSNVITSGTGSTDRPTLTLQNGATATGTYVSNANNGSWFIGTYGGKGGAVVTGTNGVTASTLSTPGNSGYLRVGIGAVTSAGIVYRSDGTLTISNGGKVLNDQVAAIGMDGGKGSATITGAGSLLQSSNELRIGNYRYDSTPDNFGEGTLNISNGGQAKAGASLYVGNQGGKGTVTVDGIGSLLQNTAYYMYIGESRFDSSGNNYGDGTVAITNGALVKSDGLIAVGDYGGKGKVTIDGAGSVLQSAVADFFWGSTRYSAAAGMGSDGTVLITNGGSALCKLNVNIGGGGGKAYVSVDGLGSLLQSSNGGIYVGENRYDASATNYGDGTLSLTNGAHAICDGLVAVGDYGGKGHLTVDGVGTLLQSVNNNFYIGSNRYDSSATNYGDGTLTITNGGTALCKSNAYIGNDGGLGTTTVDGTGSILQVTNGYLFVGSFTGYSISSNRGFGTGNLTLSNGGVARCSINTSIGSMGNSGTVTVNSNSLLDVGTDLNLGSGATTIATSVATLNINPGGQVHVAGTTYTFQVSNTATINLQGGTLQTGAFDRSAGGTLNWTSGTLAITGAAGMTLSTANLGVTFSLGANHTFNVTNAFTIPAAFNFSVDGGTLTAGSVANQNTFAVNSGTATTGAITGAGNTSVSGTLTASSITQNSLTVGGTVHISPNGGSSGLSVLKSLTIPVDGSSNPTGNLDLNDNDLIVDYSATGISPFSTIRGLVNYGLTHATGITSTTGNAAPQDKVLAVVDNANHNLTSLSGVTLASLGLSGNQQVLGKYTYYGDANLDGKVTGADYTYIDLNLGQGTPAHPNANVDWAMGDFNQDGQITGADYTYIDLNLGKGVGTPLAYDEFQSEMIALHTAEFSAVYTSALDALIATVPEPGTLGLLGLGGFALLTRRRRAR